MRFLLDDSLLLLIDLQSKLIPAMAQKEQLILRNQKLLEGLNALGLPIVATEQYPAGLGATVPEIAQLLLEAAVFEKSTFSAADDAAVLAALKKIGRKNVILTGVESHVCVQQTALDLVATGFNVMVLADCVSSRNLADKEIAFKRFAAEGVLLGTSESLLFELTRASTHPAFRAISKVVK